jgi:two-component system, OmpR family, sensor histidine kinase TctE
VTARREQRSLFGEILDWMLAPLLVLWPMSLALTALVAQSIANRPFDRELGELAQILARQASVQTDAPARDPTDRRSVLESTAISLLRNDDADTLFVQVLGHRGELVVGDPRLAVPEADRASEHRVRFRDDVIGDEPVRVAWVWLAAGTRGGDSDALVQVAETLEKRSRLATEIIKGVILPQFVILPLAVLLVWYALTRGIRPLAQLQQRIRQRESSDLSPIPEGDVPDEVAPLVRAINDLLERLGRSIAAQRHFLADAAHQLKTPLAGLRTQAELAAREIDSGRGDPASMRHSLRQIAVSSQRAAHMVNQLLAMARAEDTGQVLRRKALNLAAITRAVVRDFVPRAMERGIDLGYEGPENSEDGAATVVLGEPVLLGELVRNLVDNALQYTPAGGAVTARITVEEAGAVVLQVEDTGPGIAPPERELVFQAFYRALGTQVDGSGLGLAIVMEVVQHHGATITVADARPRHGATAQWPGALFTVSFPRHGQALPAATSSRVNSASAVGFVPPT